MAIIRKLICYSPNYFLAHMPSIQLYFKFVNVDCQLLRAHRDQQPQVPWTSELKQLLLIARPQFQKSSQYSFYSLLGRKSGIALPLFLDR